MKTTDFGYYAKPMSQRTLLKKQKEVLSDLIHTHYRTNIGIVIYRRFIEDSIEEIKNAKIQYVFRDAPTTYLFVTIIIVYLPYRLSNRFTNHRVKFQISETNIIKDVPITALLNWYRSGFPRDGKDIRKFTEYPWKMLEPIKAYIDYKITLNQLKKKSLKVVISTYGIFKTYYEAVLPMILKTEVEEPIFRQFLSEQYEALYQENMADMFKAHSYPLQGWMYIGVAYKNITEDTFYPETIENNPFVGLALQAHKEMMERWTKERDEKANELKERPNK